MHTEVPPGSHVRGSGEQLQERAELGVSRRGGGELRRLSHHKAPQMETELGESALSEPGK